MLISVAIVHVQLENPTLLVVADTLKEPIVDYDKSRREFWNKV